MSGCFGSKAERSSEQMPARDESVGGDEQDCVVLEIIDRGSGAVVSGTAPSKIVGQKVKLQVRTRPAGRPMTNIRWTIPGETVKNYTQSRDRATRTDLAAGDLDAANVDFYWISGGNKAVSVSATVGGAALTAAVTYNALAPTGATMTSVTGTVAVGDPGFPGAGLELHYGTNVTPGIDWTLTCTAPAGGAGEMAGTQTTDSYRTRTTNAGAVETRGADRAWVLDNTVPYAAVVALGSGASGTWTSDDTPGLPLSARLQRRTVDQNFRIYFMYKPSGGDSIWVTLMRLDWDWAAETTRTGAATANNWGAATGVSNTPNPTGAASTELPTWTANVADLTYA